MAEGAHPSSPTAGQWMPEVPVVGRDDHRPFAGDDRLQPLHRLARYVPEPLPPTPADARQAEEGREAGDWIDPTPAVPDAPGTAAHGGFVEVDRGALADVARVYVFVHGWLPGGLASASRSLAVDGRVPLAWDDDVTNHYGKAPIKEYSPLLAALAERDPQAAVLWFSWVDQSSTDTSLFAARQSLRRAPINGRRLAAALSHAIWNGSDPRRTPGPQVHLIGHSHGSVVAANAALALPIPPEQLTLLDCPEDWFSRTGGAAGLLADTLPRLRPGRRAGTTFVDSYATMFGRAYHEEPGLGAVVDVRVAPAFDPEAIESRSSQAHQYAVVWYTQTVLDEQAQAGFGWSPLFGFDPATLDSSYLVTKGGRVLSLPRRKAEEVTAAEHIVTDLAVPTERLTSRSPDVSVMLDLPADALFVEFDLAFARCGRNARVDVAFNGDLECSSYAAAPVPAGGRFVRVAPGRATIQFRLVDSGRAGSATVSRLRVVRDPSAIRNADDRAAMMQAAKLGAVAGAAAATAALATAWAAARLVRRAFG